MKEIRRYLQQQITELKALGVEPASKDWGRQEGVLISLNEARQLIPILKNNEFINSTLENWKTEHEIDYTKDYNYRSGYVKAMNDVMNFLTKAEDSH